MTIVLKIKNRLTVDEDKGEPGKDKDKQTVAIFDFEYNRDTGHRKRRRWGRAIEISCDKDEYQDNCLSAGNWPSGLGEVEAGGTSRSEQRLLSGTFI